MNIKVPPKSSPLDVFPVKEGVKCRCPYCSTVFVWPPENMKCPSCGKTVRPPAGYSRPGREVRQKSIEKIQKQADKAYRSIGEIPSLDKSKKSGFLLAAAIGLVLLGSVTITSSMKHSSVEKRKKKDPMELSSTDITVLAMAFAHYNADVGHYPSYQDGGLLALVSDPGEADWYGPYINVIQNDGWNRPYYYNRTNGIPVLVCAGPDRQYFTADDLVATTNDFQVHAEFIRHDPKRYKKGKTPQVRIM